MNIISFYGSHNASISTYIDGKIEVIELERFVSQKNIGFSQYLPIKNPQQVLDDILKYIHDRYNVHEFDLCLHANTGRADDGKHTEYYKKIPAKEYKLFKHHESHANSTFYQSDFDKALIFSIDGGGSDGFFNVYDAKRKNGCELIHKRDSDIGFAYMLFGHYMEDIKHEPLHIGNLVYPGKLMGLCSYGKVREEWLSHFEDYYENMPIFPKKEKLDTLKRLGEKIDTEFDVKNRLSGKAAYDICATSQKAFENVIIKEIKRHYKGGPLCFTGGCALNIILNRRLKDEIADDFYVAPNSNDCGLSAGAILGEIKPSSPVDLTYAGLPVLDSNTYHIYFSKEDSITIKELAAEIYRGKIVGCVNKTSEHGPRALGNRSVLCNPMIPDMKDKLNKKVKNREWYRPFAPVVTLEDCHKFFDLESESRHMGLLVRVKEEWRDKLPAITHVDGTARVQTVTREQNPWLHALLQEFSGYSGVPILLNTSFNVAGKPILTTLEEAFEVYKNTELDGVYYNGRLKQKNSVKNNISSNSKKKKYLKINYVPGANIGDNVFPYMVYKENIPFTWSSHVEHEKIISTGSIIGVGSNKDTIIWGSGIINQNTKMHPEAIPVLARGKYSAVACNNPDLPLGDPAIALPHFYKGKRKSSNGKIAIVPHMIDHDKLVKFLNDNNVSNDRYVIIPPNGTYYSDRYEKFIDDMISCDKVISTSLHGLIIANAYGIPSAWWRFGNNLMGDDIKFPDYSSCFGHEIHKNDNFFDIKDYWCPSDTELDRVTGDILNSSPIYKELPEEYYTDEISLTK